MTDYEIDFSFMQRQFGHVDRLSADSIDEVDDKALEYFTKFYIGDEDTENYSDFMVESIMEVKE